MSAILGGLFNSRLNMKLREEKGYTYGAGAGFDMRRGAGPFAARAAVNTEVTVPAIVDMLAELDADPRRRRSTDAELRRRTRLPRRRLPAPVRDRGRGRRRARQPGRPWPGVEELVGYRVEHRGGRHRRQSRPRPGRTSTSTTPRSSSSATWTRSARRSRRPASGRIVIERDEVPVAAGPLDRGRASQARSTTRTRPDRRPAPRSRTSRYRRRSPRPTAHEAIDRPDPAETFSRRVVSGE